jgi:hypothetical protein
MTLRYFWYFLVHCTFDGRWKSQDRRGKSALVVLLFVELRTMKVKNMVKIPLPVVYLVPYPYFPIHQALQAPLASGIASPSFPPYCWPTMPNKEMGAESVLRIQ